MTKEQKEGGEIKEKQGESRIYRLSESSQGGRVQHEGVEDFLCILPYIQEDYIKKREKKTINNLHICFMNVVWFVQYDVNIQSYSRHDCEWDLLLIAFDSPDVGDQIS